MESFPSFLTRVRTWWLPGCGMVQGPCGASEAGLTRAPWLLPGSHHGTRALDTAAVLEEVQTRPCGEEQRHLPPERRSKPSPESSSEVQALWSHRPSGLCHEFVKKVRVFVLPHTPCGVAKALVTGTVLARSFLLGAQIWSRRASPRALPAP